MISHDIAEVYKLASNVLIVEDGKIKKSGNPDILFENSQISGKFKFSAKVIKIEKADTIFIVTLLIQNNLTKVVATQEEVQNMSIGDDVLVASKAFNPIIIT
jgi:molybdate transport system ATP-binding protein